MSPINPKLLAALKKKTGLKERALYNRISERANALGVRREIAALDVASANSVNINLFAKESELEKLRDARRASPSAHFAQPALAPKVPKKSSRSGKRSPGKYVWIVHGRDDRYRRAIADFVRSVGLEPLEWATAMKATRKGTPYVGEVLDKAFQKASAVIVVMTPDDEARLKKEHWRKGEEAYEKKLMGQARPNVLFEAGMAFATHQNETIIVEIGKCRPFSDTLGRHVVKMNDSAQRRKELVDRLQAAGCVVDTSGNAWMEAGVFS